MNSMNDALDTRTNNRISAKAAYKSGNKLGYKCLGCGKPVMLASRDGVIPAYFRIEKNTDSHLLNCPALIRKVFLLTDHQIKNAFTFAIIDIYKSIIFNKELKSVPSRYTIKTPKRFLRYFLSCSIDDKYGLVTVR